MAMFPVLCLDVSQNGIATLTAFDVQVNPKKRLSGSCKKDNQKENF